jgi:hypothetical protein
MKALMDTITKEISYKEAAAALKEQIKKAPFRAEALKLLEAIVLDVPPLEEDKMPTAKG